MGYRLELLGILEFLPIQYSDTGPIKGLYLKNTRSTVKLKNMCGTDVPYRRTIPYGNVAVTQYTEYSTVRYNNVRYHS